MKRIIYILFIIGVLPVYAQESQINGMINEVGISTTDFKSLGVHYALGNKHGWYFTLAIPQFSYYKFAPDEDSVGAVNEKRIIMSFSVGFEKRFWINENFALKVGFSPMIYRFANDRDERLSGGVTSFVEQRVFAYGARIPLGVHYTFAKSRLMASLVFTPWLYLQNANTKTWDIDSHGNTTFSTEQTGRTLGYSFTNSVAIMLSYRIFKRE